jgi:hypothetical protein
MLAHGPRGQPIDQIPRLPIVQDPQTPFAPPLQVQTYRMNPRQAAGFVRRLSPFHRRFKAAFDHSPMLYREKNRQKEQY